MEEKSFNSVQRIKRDFFSYRNGVTADLLRKGGTPFRIIFGLTLPQLNEIALANGKDAELARLLWKNNSTRCSMLIAPMLMPVDKFGKEEAFEWCNEIPSCEVADVLCIKLLSSTEFAEELIKELANGDHMKRYTAMRLMMNLIRQRNDPKELWKKIAEFELLRNDTTIPNRLLANQIIEEFDFLLEDI